jgi:segregation and condensation protein B
MSLKAKLEAVIYAAEEPVTLAQLTALFTADALEWKADREAASTELAAEAIQPLPPANEEFSYAVQEQNPESATVAEMASAALEPVSPITSEPSQAIDVESSAQEAEANPAEGAAENSESDAKRLARQRDREVRAILRQLLDELIASYASDERGVEIREIAGGYRMATKPECHDAVRLFVRSLKPPLKLSLPALETLAVIAYKQPVTAPEVSEIRGVETGGVLGSLLARKLIATAGRKPVIGRPILYKTTREFLLRFGLKDVSELPSMDEFEKMAAVELDELEAVNEGETAPEANAASGPEFDEGASEELEDAPAEGHQAPAEVAATEEPSAGTPAIAAEEPPAEAAPAAPPYPEQAETEISPL